MARVSTKKEYQTAQKQYELDQDKTDEMRSRLRQLERKRKAKELERQIGKKPCRGFGVDDGSSQKTSTDSSSGSL
eukprot:COSAG05_NODE_13741_length_419_cov_1.131250_1_plen_74_part_01